MSLLPLKPETKSPVKTMADNVKLMNYSTVKNLAYLAQYNITSCWNNPNYTPQEFLDQFGIHAAASMLMNANLVQLVNDYEQTIGESLFDYSVLSYVKPYTVNSDGTITVNQ